MSDNFYGKIEIGGDLPASKVLNFYEAFKKDIYTVSEISDDKLKKVKSTQELLTLLEKAVRVQLNDFMELYIDEGYMTIINNEARYGMFEHLETWCENNGLSYRRNSASFTEMDSEISSYDATTGTKLQSITNVTEEQTISRGTIKNLFKYLTGLTKENLALEAGKELSNDERFIFKTLMSNGFDKMDALNQWLEGQNAEITLPPLRII